MGLSSMTRICVECRVARKGYSASCGVEGHKMTDMGTKFRAPKKRDIKAWKRIAQGDYMTEQSVTDIREQYEQKDKPGRWYWMMDRSTGKFDYILSPAVIRSRKRKKTVRTDRDLTL